MVAVDSVVFVVEEPFLEPVVKGGAQRVLRDTFHVLQCLGYKCAVLQGYWSNDRSEFEGIYTCATSDGSMENKTLATTTAVALLRDADLVVSVDRLLPILPYMGRRVLSLSNLAYTTEQSAVRIGSWDRIWVPSEFLQERLVSRFGIPVQRIDILPPAIGVASVHATNRATAEVERTLDQRGIPLNRRLLFPHRSDPSKGGQLAIGLLRRLVSEDRRWTLIMTAPSEYDDIDNQAHFRRLLDTDADVRENLVVVPWLPLEVMPDYYALGGCTIFASQLPESFGLAAIESVAYGIPVVAVEAGALTRRIIEPGGIHFVDALDSAHTSSVVTQVCGNRASPTVSSSVRARYSMDAHARAVRRAMSLIEGEA